MMPGGFNPASLPGDPGSSNLFLSSPSGGGGGTGTWAAVDAMVRARLQLTVSVLPDSILDPIVGAYAGFLLAQYPCVGAYADLTGPDLTAFNYALALMVAASARPWLPKSNTSGELIRYKQGTTEYQYADMSRAQNLAQTKTTEQLWLDEAWLMLRQVACIGAAYTSMKASFHLSAISGPRRRQEAAGFLHLPGGNPLYPILVADIFSWRDLWGIR